MTVSGNRRVAIKDFYGLGEHIYVDQLGWQAEDKREARTLVSKEVWDYFVCLEGLNVAFYFPENDTFYGLHTEELPYTLYELPRDRSRSLYTGLQCVADTHQRGKAIYTTDDIHSLWNEVRIAEHSFEYVLNHSFILNVD